MVADKTLSEILVTNDHSLTMKNLSYDEAYHSLHGARTEARELYIVRSGIQQRLQKTGSGPLKVLDIGLGLAYNALSTIEAWFSGMLPSQDLHLTSVEIDRSLVALLLSGEAPWTRGWELSWLGWVHRLKMMSEHEAQAIITHRDGQSVCIWTIHLGDASAPEMWGRHDFGRDYEFIWQDPFSPQKNPQLWSEAWFAKLKEVSSPQVCMMTYSVARKVRDHLAASGWCCERIAALGEKKHWLRAWLPPPGSIG